MNEFTNGDGLLRGWERGKEVLGQDKRKDDGLGNKNRLAGK